MFTPLPHPHRALGTPSREEPTASCSSSARGRSARGSSLSAAAVLSPLPRALLGLLLPQRWENLRNPDGPQKCPALEQLAFLTVCASAAFLVPASGFGDQAHWKARPLKLGARCRDSHRCGLLYLPDSQAGSAFLAHSCPGPVGFVCVSTRTGDSAMQDTARTLVLTVPPPPALFTVGGIHTCGPIPGTTEKGTPSWIPDITVWSPGLPGC